MLKPASLNTDPAVNRSMKGRSCIISDVDDTVFYPSVAWLENGTTITLPNAPVAAWLASRGNRCLYRWAGKRHFITGRPPSMARATLNALQDAGFFLEGDELRCLGYKDHATYVNAKVDAILRVLSTSQHARAWVIDDDRQVLGALDPALSAITGESQLPCKITLLHVDKGNKGLVASYQSEIM